jgi:hypothetical protein
LGNGFKSRRKDETFGKESDSVVITAEEFVLEIDNKEENKNFKLATVVGLFDNDTAKIQFDGEDTPSEKQYAYLDSYVPEVDDRVLLGILGGTYVILGKVNYNVPPSTEEEIDRYIFDLKTVSILKGLQVSGVLTINNGATIVGSVGVNGTVTATGLSSTGSISASGNLSGANISTPGTLGAGATTLLSLTVTGDASANNVTGNTVKASSNFDHAGSGLKFFGKSSYSSQRTVNKYIPQPIGTEANVNTVNSRLNELITALQAYGLIGGN